MSTLSPAPWHAQRSQHFHREKIYVLHKEEFTNLIIAEVDNEADAHLIAAAPELLGACKAAREHLQKLNDLLGEEMTNVETAFSTEEILDTSNRLGYLMEKLDAALAKAEPEGVK